MAAISVTFAAQNHSRLSPWPPHILWLFACLAWAGATVLWAFRPETSFIRFLQQFMIIISIVIPTLLADKRADVIRVLFLCFASASVLNVFFVLTQEPIFALYGGKGVVNIGYPGYFGGKNYLGECAALTLLLSLYEMSYRGVRRTLGIIASIIAIFLVFKADLKTALGLAIITPLLAGATLFVAKKMRLSPALILLSVSLFWIALSSVSNFNAYRLSSILYGDLTLSDWTLDHLGFCKCGDRTSTNSGMGISIFLAGRI